MMLTCDFDYDYNPPYCYTHKRRCDMPHDVQPDKPSLVPPPEDRIPVGDPALEPGTAVPPVPALAGAPAGLPPGTTQLVMVPQGRITSNPAEHFTLVASVLDGNMPTPNDPTIIYISLRGGGGLEIDRGSGKITKWARWDLAANKPVGLSITVTHG